MTQLKLFLAVFCFLCLLPSSELKAQWNSQIVYPDANGALTYVRDTAGNVIPDFSHAGYMGGGVGIPNVLAEFTLSPIAGDNTAHIQNAIDQAMLLPKDVNGIRGAILLTAGRYEIHGTINLNQNGVILRGVGDGADTTTNTVLIGVGNTPNQRTIIVAGGGSNTSWSGKVASTQTNITSDWVKVGEYSFKVANPAAYAVDDNIVIYHPCTQAWLDAIDGGGTATEPNWSVGSQPLVFNRRIVAIQDSLITVDVPLYNHLKKSLAQSYIYKYDRSGIKTQVGIEDLRVDIETAGGDDEAHAWNAVKLVQVEDAWVRNCTFLHFGLAGVGTETATRITIENCQALDPVAIVTGARMYNFNLLKASSQVLVKDCHASNGRHHYVSNGTSWVSGCVFLRVGSEAAYNASEGHRRWTMGLLYDNQVETAIRDNNRVLLALYNRGTYGTAHGWSAVHSVAWNCDVASARLVVEKPPTGQNYAIACSGTILGSGPFNQMSGYIEGANQANPEIVSLYEAQLFARLNGLSPNYLNTSIQEFDPFPDFQLFPNPTANLLHIQLSLEAAENKTIQARLYSPTGQLILTEKFVSHTQFDLEGLSSGIYLLHLQQGDKQTVKRIRKE